MTRNMPVLGLVPARMQGVEIGAAIDAQQHRLAVDHKGRVSVSQRGFRDQRIAFAPVVANWG